jgi:hypothetical protein
MRSASILRYIQASPDALAGLSSNRSSRQARRRSPKKPHGSPNSFARLLREWAASNQPNKSHAAGVGKPFVNLSNLFQCGKLGITTVTGAIKSCPTDPGTEMRSSPNRHRWASRPLAALPTADLVLVPRSAVVSTRDIRCMRTSMIVTFPITPSPTGSCGTGCTHIESLRRGPVRCADSAVC